MENSTLYNCGVRKSSLAVGPCCPQEFSAPRNRFASLDIESVTFCDRQSATWGLARSRAFARLLEFEFRY
jgi:hypothetical protein